MSPSPAGKRNQQTHTHDTGAIAATHAAASKVVSEDEPTPEPASSSAAFFGQNSRLRFGNCVGKCMF